MNPFDLTGSLTYLSDAIEWKSPAQPQMGWMCPRCQHVWAPFVRECGCQPPTVAGSTIHVKINGANGEITAGDTKFVFADNAGA